jgi:hypothetical protein
MFSHPLSNLNAQWIFFTPLVDFGNDLNGSQNLKNLASLLLGSSS